MLSTCLYFGSDSNNICLTTIFLSAKELVEEQKCTIGERVSIYFCLQASVFWYQSKKRTLQKRKTKALTFLLLSECN